MPKVYKVEPTRLSDPEGTEKEVETMKVGAVHYMKQLGFNKVSIDTMLDLKDSKDTDKKVLGKSMSLKRKSPESSSDTIDYTDYHIQRLIRLNPFQTNEDIAEVLRQINEKHSKPVVKRWLINLGFTRSNPTKVSSIKREEKEKRLLWAKEHVDWTNKQWKDVIWSSEARFCIHGKEGPPLLLRKDKEDHESCHFIQSSKNDGGNLMVWSYIWAEGFGPLVFVEGDMEETGYINNMSDYLQPLLLKSRNKNYIYQEDNKPYHSGEDSQWWKMTQGLIDMENWPSQSQDINPMEDVWFELSTKVKEKNSSIHNVQDLKEELEKAWNQMNISYIQTLYQNMPSKCKEVIVAKGGTTKL